MTALLSQKMVNGLVSRPDFYERMPEFGQLKGDDTARAARPGCGSCSRRRAQKDMLSTFTTVLLSMSQASLLRFKAYAGVSALQCQWFNRTTGKYEIRII